MGIVAEDIITGFTEPPTAAPVATTVVPVTATTPPPPPPTTTAPPPPTTTQPPAPPRLSGKEREALIAHLGNIDLSSTDKLVLTPRQRLAIAQELEHQQLGLQPFNDPTPWQRLNRQQQAAFNEKYLALRPDLQEYSKAQFTALSEERQEHAFNMFLSLDVKTLTEVIEGELVREREAAQQQQQQRNRFQEQPRSQGRTNFNQFQQPQQQQQFQQQAPQFQANRQRPNFDPRRQPAQPQQQQFQPQQQQFQQRQPQQQQPQPQQQRQISAADQRHLAQAEAQIAEAVRLQGCLANPAAC